MYLLPNIFKLLHAFGHLLEAAINLTWPGRKTIRILPRQQISKDKLPEERACGHIYSLLPWSLRLSAIFPALQTNSLHTLLEMDAAGENWVGLNIYSLASPNAETWWESRGRQDGRGKKQLFALFPT